MISFRSLLHTVPEYDHPILTRILQHVLATGNQKMELSLMNMHDDFEPFVVEVNNVITMLEENFIEIDAEYLDTKQCTLHLSW